MNFAIKEFFGKEGLTLTSANHIANMAKEYYTKIETEIKSMSPFSETAQVIGTSEGIAIHTGISSEEFALVQEKLEKIAECKGLIAYLREAIKERDALKHTIDSWKDTEARSKVVEPVRERTITEDEIMAKWSVGDLIRYYRLEAKCATFGKYIHVDGSLSNLRRVYHEVVNNPSRVQGQGRDTVIFKDTPTITEEEIENTFFKLQEEYRNAQAELNGIKHTMDVEIEQDSLKKENEYLTAYKEYSLKFKEILTQENIVRTETLNELQKLKIVIPIKFKGIYEEITKLAKS